MKKPLPATQSKAQRVRRHIGRLDFAPVSSDPDSWRTHLRQANVRFETKRVRKST